MRPLDYNKANSQLVPTTPTALPTIRLSEEAKDHLEEALAFLWARLESEHSKRAYRNNWAYWVQWCARQHVDVLQVQPLHVLRYVMELAEQKRSKATRGLALVVIRQVYGAFVVAGLVATNPAREVKNIKTSSAPRTPWLSEGELKRLLAAPGPTAEWAERRNWLMCATLLGLSWRRAEVARLCRDDLTEAPHGFTAKALVKGNKVAFVPVPIWLSKEITAWCAENEIVAGPVFPKTRKHMNVPVGPSTVWNAVRQLAAKAGIERCNVTPHALRRSFATVLSQRGALLKDLQMAMSHSSEATTEKYVMASRAPSQAPGESLGDLVGLKTTGR